MVIKLLLGSVRTSFQIFMMLFNLLWLTLKWLLCARRSWTPPCKRSQAWSHSLLWLALWCTWTFVYIYIYMKKSQSFSKCFRQASAEMLSSSRDWITPANPNPSPEPLTPHNDGTSFRQGLSGSPLLLLTWQACHAWSTHLSLCAGPFLLNANSGWSMNQSTQGSQPTWAWIASFLC